MYNFSSKDKTGVLVGADKFYEQFVENVNKWELIPENAHVIIYYSGGKDSNVLLDLFVRFREQERSNFTLEVITAAFPRMVYLSNDPKQQEAITKVISYWKNRGIEIEFCIPKDSYTDEKLEEGTFPPCYICEQYKTRILSDRYNDKGYNGAYIAVSHSTWDMMGYVDELVQMVGRNESWKDIPKESVDNDRFIHIAKRCYPKLSLEKLTYIRPLINFASPDFKKYADAREIPLIPECCAEIAKGGWYVPYKKAIMEALKIREWVAPRRDPVTENVRFDLDYDQIMTFAKRNGAMPDPDDLRSIPLEKLGI